MAKFTMKPMKAGPLPGVPHFAKLPTAPKARTSELNTRVQPFKRMDAPSPPKPTDGGIS